MATKPKKKISDMNIHEKIAAVEQKLGILSEDKKGYGYTYTSGEEIYPKLQAALNEYRVNYYHSFVPGTFNVQEIERSKENYDKEKKEYRLTPTYEYLVSAEMAITWVNLDNPEDTFTATWAIAGSQADASQAFGSALTYSDRYYIMKASHSATTSDDPDALVSKRNNESDKIEKEVYISQIEALVAKHMNKDNQAGYEDLITQYITAPNGMATKNYKNAKNALQLSRLYEATLKYFNVKGE